MRTVKFFTLAFVSLTIFSFFINFALSQNPEWINFTAGNYVGAIAVEGNYIWVGTSGGLVKIDRTTGNMTFYNRANSGLPSNWVWSIAIDGQGNKWIGTGGGGLAKFDGVNWTVYNTGNSGLPDNDVNAIAIDGQGNKWIGTGWIGIYGGGLAKFDGARWTVYNTSNSGLPSNDVLAIAIDGQGNKWIGTGGGLAKFDGVNWTVYNTSNSGLPSDVVSAIAIDGQGNKWIGTDEEGGLAKFDGKKWTVYNTSNSGLPSDVVLAIAIDGQGNKWIGTDGGLAVYREGGVILDVEKYTEEMPSKFELYQNYPNPFNPSTTIEFDIFERANVKIVIYDVLGREVERVVDGEYDAGRYRVNFVAQNLPSGVYICRMEAGGFVKVVKMVLMK